MKAGPQRPPSGNKCSPLSAPLRRRRRISLTDVSSVDRYNFSLATQPELATLLCVYLKAKAAEPRPHLLASLVAMNAHIIPLSPCKPRAASCATNSESLPLTKTSTRLRNSLCNDQFFHGNFAYLHSAEDTSHPSVVTHTSFQFFTHVVQQYITQVTLSLLVILGSPSWPKLKSSLFQRSHRWLHSFSTKIFFACLQHISGIDIEVFDQIIIKSVIWLSFVC